MIRTRKARALVVAVVLVAAFLTWGLIIAGPRDTLLAAGVAVTDWVDRGE